MERFKNWLANRAFDLWMRLTPVPESPLTDATMRLWLAGQPATDERTMEALNQWREQDQPPLRLRLCHCPVMTGGAIHHWPDCPQGMTQIPQGIRKSMES